MSININSDIVAITLIVFVCIVIIVALLRKYFTKMKIKKGDFSVDVENNKTDEPFSQRQNE